MPARKGSNNGVVGKKGRSGRKSAYQEKADAEMLHKMFFDILKRDDIKKKLSDGNYSIKDSFIAKAFAGSERHQIAIFNKLFPDMMQMDVEGNVKTTVSGTVKTVIDKIYGGKSD